MFSRRKETKAETNPPANKRNAGQRSKAQLPLFDIPGMEDLDNIGNDMGDDMDDDDDLEAELAALQAGLDIRKVVSRKRLEDSLNQPKKQAVEIISEDESDDEVDENDPELLAELGKIESVYKDEAKAKEDLQSRFTNLLPTKPRIETPSIVPPAVKLRAAPPPPATTQSIPVSRSSTNIPTIKPSASNSSISTGNPTLDLIQERLQLYKEAHRNAITSSETAKIRRLDRGIKTLETQLKSAKAGKPVNEEDIPPPVAVSNSKPSIPENSTNDIILNKIEQKQNLLIDDAVNNSSGVPPPLPPRIRKTSDILPVDVVQPSAPPLSPPQVIKEDASNKKTIDLLNERKNQYRQAAMVAKRNNDVEKTREYVKIAKKFDLIIEAIEQGQEVDLKGMPPPPPPPENVFQPTVAVRAPAITKPSNLTANQRQSSIDRNAPLEIPTGEVLDDPSVFNPPPAPTSINEALQQRLEKYKSGVIEANESGNSSKARRMGRIVKQYEDAIKAYKAGKPVDFEDLPTPPGFAPIPLSNVAPKQEATLLPPSQHLKSVGDKPALPLISPQSASNAKSVSSNSPLNPSNSNLDKALSPPQRQLSNSIGKSSQKSSLSLHEKQLAAILERQKLFKESALEAKKRGDIQAAKEYLRVAKGFEPMITAAKCGLPVNMDSLPHSPNSNTESAFEIISKEDCEPAGDRLEMFERLEKELLAQIEMCSGNRLHFSKMGDVPNAHKFESMLLNSKKDLNYVKNLFKRGDPVPRFHYETKTFSIVRCCTDLGDDDFELTIIRGINYSCSNPTEIDTYIKYEFPFPVETPQSSKTATIKNTNNPEYNATSKLTINRKSRNCTSVFKRKGLKLEVWSKGGFLRSDSLLGCATVKLAPLETRCILHESFDVMENRKPIGGKVEVKLRIREPLLAKQVDTMCEKWLIISANNVTRV